MKKNIFLHEKKLEITTPWGMYTLLK
jgi:hypothetical protein